ncbi:MAG: hypothetical protein EOP06_25075 [Proteobacteria bacterium]|nr:MAG: hypothetical protein EOP06_25075 [Pseudomonadota bacterium]
MFFRSKPTNPIDGNFFPPEFKSFPYKEGDLLSSQGRNGKFSVSKVLKIDKVELRRGKSISIQGQTFTAPEDDFLLIVSCTYGEYEFGSIEEARVAAKAGIWTMKIAHVPNRPLGAAQGQTLVGHAPVQESELSGYYEWKRAFDQGEAWVF